MNALLLIGLGPVQEFIERSRRMRDLWMGSHILSEMARAVAHSLASDSWTLIFPAFRRGDEDLEPCEGMWRESGQRPLAVVNKVLATRQSTDDETALASAKTARRAAVDAWQRFARLAERQAGGLLRPDLPRGHHPSEVVEDSLEVVVSWSNYEDERGYAKALQEAERRLASRKRLRDFHRWEGSNLPKSSLDGFRETVLVRERNTLEARRVTRRFRLGDTEHLDGVGIVKRMGGEPEQFVPITRVALAPWIGALVKQEQVRLADETSGEPEHALSTSWKQLVEACESFDVPRVDLRAVGWMPRGFPYDGEIFLEGQWPNLTFGHRSRHTPEEEKGFVEKYVRPVLRRLVERSAAPFPYVACLVADGDRMGKAIASLGDPERHVRFSQCLTEFARGARTIVESNEHFGVLVYSGGDDILAFLPVHTAVRCAAALYRTFHDCLKDSFEVESEIPTLSVGIAIAHVLSPMGELQALGREAEKLAKYGETLPEPDTRDALAVILDKRSGGQTRWRCPWRKDPLQALGTLAELFEERRLPGKLPYELRDVLKHFPHRDSEAASLFWAQCLTKDVRAVLRRKRTDGSDASRLTLEDIDLCVDGERDKYGDIVDQVVGWVERALISQAIGESRSRVNAVSGLRERS